MSAPADRVAILDTTLRDGEQSPGCSMDRRQKLALARALAELGVDVIEAGFPAASEDDAAAVAAIAAEVREPTVAALARCRRGDVERAAAALERAKRPRLHLFLATSPLHLRHKLGMSESPGARGDRRARGARAPPGRGGRVLRRGREPQRAGVPGRRRSATALAAGATILNVPDTVGYATPEEYGALFRFLRARLPGGDRVVLSCHCHDDLGLAVANSLAAVANGARQVECTLNGIGERAGNAALEEIAMALKVRRDRFGLSTGIRSERLAPASRLLVALTGNPVARHKAIVGENAFAHESGIHQHGILSHRETYEIMRPEEVGVERSTIVLGKHSGRAALAARLAELGIAVGEEELEDVFLRFKRLAERKREVLDADLEALALGVERDALGPWRLVALSVQGGIGQGALPSAVVELAHADGRRVREAASGDGPVDAIFAALRRAAGLELALSDFQVRALTRGADAQGEARLAVEHEGRRLHGRAISTDILEASALALLEVINRIERLRGAAPLPSAANAAR
ncbi:MAG: 2-isopropylmalate synthase [Xanthomonadales bacterium]|nr:2-isopropylmalate synthase [Xanthomonadales bacterium]